MQKYYFVYCKKSRNQVSVLFSYRKAAARLCQRLNEGRGCQYAIGWLRVWIGHDMMTKGPGRINLSGKVPVPDTAPLARRKAGRTE